MKVDYKGQAHKPVLDKEGRECDLMVEELEASLGYPPGYTGHTLPDGTALSKEERLAILTQGWPITVSANLLQYLHHLLNIHMSICIL